VRAASVHDAGILERLGIGCDAPEPMRTPDGRTFRRFPPSYIRAEHRAVLHLAETLDGLPPLTGGVAGWPAWFAAAWLEVRSLLRLREMEARRG
jgi:hypothetical protein